MRSFCIFLFDGLTILTWAKCGHFSLQGIIILVAVLFLGTQYINRVKGLKEDFCSIYVFFYLFCSHTIVLTFPVFFNVGIAYMPRFWVFVHILYIIFFLTCFLFRPRKGNYSFPIYITQSIPKMQWNILIMVNKQTADQIAEGMRFKHLMA